jgi:tetratricopeptide (TPR) repeat protein
MRKDPAERYSSAVSLAEDIQRFLSGRPLRARPSTLLYRARKFVRRNPVGVGTAALVAVLLVGATALTLHQSRRIQEEAERVARERDKALRVRGFLLEMFGATGPGGAPGDTVTARGLLDRRAAALDREWGHDPEMQAEMLTVLAEGYERLGLWDEAEPLAREALGLRRDVLGEDHPDVAASLNVLGWLLHEQGRLEEAETHLRDAVDRGREAFGPEGETEGDARLARALNDLGVVREARGDYEEAAALYRESLEMRRRLEGEAAPGVAITASNLSVVLYRRGELEEAVAAAREALELYRRAFGPDHRRTTIVQSNLAAMQSYLGDHAGAEAEHREILERRRRLHGSGHPQVAFSMTMLANELVAQDRAGEAEPLLREALEIQREALGPDHPNVGSTLRVLADVLLQEGRSADALVAVDEALGVTRRRLGPEHEEVAALRARRARVLEALGREGEAEAEWRASLRISAEALGPHHLRTADVALSLARHLVRRGGGPEVAELADRVEAAVEASDAPADHAVVQGLARLREAMGSEG